MQVGPAKGASYGPAVERSARLPSRALAGLWREEGGRCVAGLDACVESAAAGTLGTPRLAGTERIGRTIAHRMAGARCRVWLGVTWMA